MYRLFLFGIGQKGIFDCMKYYIPKTDKIKRTSDKFRLTTDTTTYEGQTLFRIQALRDIPRYAVKKGDMGGWVNSEKRLSQKGDAWIGGNAMVYNGAFVSGDAYIGDGAMAYHECKISGNARVLNDAMVYGKARVRGNAVVCDAAQIRCLAKIFDNAKICDYVQVCGKSSVFGNAVVKGTDIIDNTTIG